MNQLYPFGNRLISKSAVTIGRKEMPSQTKMCVDWLEDRKEPLRLFGRLKSLHSPFSLPSRLMGVLGARLFKYRL